MKFFNKGIVVFGVGIVLAICTSVRGQEAKREFEYGKFEELKGLSKVYVDTQGNIADRDEIVQEITKSGIGLTIVDEREDAEIVIEFESSSRLERASFNVLAKVTITSGEARVTIKGDRSDRRRVLMNFRGGKRNPAEKFAKEFVKTYKKTFGVK